MMEDDLDLNETSNEAVSLVTPSVVWNYFGVPVIIQLTLTNLFVEYVKQLYQQKDQILPICSDISRITT